MPTEENPNIKALHAHEARSGRVSYSEEVVLHETSRTRVTFIPFYIDRSEGRDLSVKIITYKRPNDKVLWVLAEEKSLSLSEPAARKLMRALQEHFAVAAEGENGDFIVIRVTNGVASVSEHSTAAITDALMQILHKEDLVQHLSGLELGNELVTSLRGAIKLKELRSAVSRLQNMLETGVVQEEEYQQWCKAHSWAFGNAYIACDDIRNISATDSVDLLLPTVLAGYRDIIELKRPNMEVLILDTSHRDFYFSSEVSKAIGQCHRYLDVFQDVAANGLRDNPEIVAYHPRAVIVIGRSNEWADVKLRALHGLNSRLTGISVMTYDQLLTQGERLIQILGAEDSLEPPEEEWDIPDIW